MKQIYVLAAFLSLAAPLRAQEVRITEDRSQITIDYSPSSRLLQDLEKGIKPPGFVPYGAADDSVDYGKVLHFAIPFGSNVELQILRHDTKAVSVNFQRRSNRDQAMPKKFPANWIQMSEPKIFRQVRYVDLIIFPLQFEAEGKAALTTQAQFRIQYSISRGVQVKDSQPFLRLYSRMFSNSWRDKGEPDPKAFPLGAFTWQPPSHSGDVYKFSIRQNGIYKLDRAFLQANTTWHVNQIDPRNFRVFNRGLEIPIYVSGESDGNFDSGDAIFLYGQALTGENDSGVWQKGDFTDENVYWILIGAQQGFRMTTRNAAPQNIYPVPPTFVSTVHLEDNPLFAPFYTEPDTDLFTWKLAYWPGNDNSQAVQHHDVAIPSVSPDNSFAASLRFNCRGRTYKNPDPDHHVVVKVNGNYVGEMFMEAYEVKEQVFSVSQSLLGGPGTVSVDLSHEVTDPALLGIDADGVASNWWELTYSRSFEASNDKLSFHFDTGSFQFVIPGFNSNTIQAFDITNPGNPVLLSGTAIVPSGGFQQITFQDAIAGNGNDYFVGVPAGVNVSDFRVDVPSNLAGLNPSTNWILIAPTNWISESGAVDLKNFRESQGLVSQTVSVEDIYDEYNFGIVSPYAIKAFLQSVYESANPPQLQSVVLVGDADWDYKDYANDGNFNLLPTYMVADAGLASAFHVFAIHSFDNYYGCFAGTDSVPEIFIGRIPARTTTEMNDALAKILFYETGITDHSWLGHNLFGADCQDYAEFEPQQDINASYLNPDPPYDPTKMYFRLPPWNCSTKDGNNNGISDVVEELNAGKAISSWIGHGSFQQWGFNSFVDVTDLPNLTNQLMPTVLLNANCFTGGFFHPTVQSLMEAFLVSPAGMVAGFAPGTYMYNFQSGFVTEPFYKDVFGLAKERNLGVLFQHLYLELDSLGETRLTQGMVAFGDPATTLAIPAEQPPQNFQIQLTGCNQILLDWDPPGSYSGKYHVYRALDVAGPFARVNSNPVATTSYIDTDLIQGTTYFYYIVAVDLDGFEGTATPILSQTAPVTPINLTLSPVTIPDGLQGTSYSQQFNGSGGAAPYTYSITEGDLPQGLTLAQNGLLSGTPVSAGTFSFTMTVVDANGCAGNQGYSLNIIPVCLFCDDFEDGTLSTQWTYKNGAWSESGGDLIGSHTRKASAVASPVFTGCGICSVEATLRTAGGTGNKIYLLAWYQNKQNGVELTLKEETDRLILKQRSGGSVVAKQKAVLTIDPNVNYQVKITFDGTNFQVSVDGTVILTMPKQGTGTPFGTVGFQVKATTGSFDRIFVQ